MSSFPKYYIHKNPAMHWSIVRTGETKCVHVFPDSTDEHRAWGPTHDGMVASGDWVEVSEACAEARKDGFQYAEPVLGDEQDEWVEITDPEHVIRDCDQLTATANVKEGVSVDNWDGCINAKELCSVGDKIRTSRGLRVRCLLTDAPAKPAAVNPEDFVIQDRGPVRLGDRCWWCSARSPLPAPELMIVADIEDEEVIREFTHGHTNNVRGVLHVMCRRSELPEIAPQKTQRESELDIVAGSDSELSKLKRQSEHRERRLKAMTRKVKNLRKAMAQYMNAQRAEIWEARNEMFPDTRHDLRRSEKADEYVEPRTVFGLEDEPAVSPVTEPKPTKPDEPQQPLRWVENCKPDKPGIWAVRRLDGSAAVCDWTEAEIKLQRTNDTRCYLGPIPEILPPLKKVTERLWLEPRGGGLWEEVWCADDNRKGYQWPDWIRTDRTREVER